MGTSYHTATGGNALILPSQREAARRLYGECCGREIRCPGPGHSRDDRSLSVQFKVEAPGGYVVHSFAGDDPMRCRDHVRDALGLEPWSPNRNRQHYAQPRHSETDGRKDRRRLEVARLLWARSIPGQGSLADTYLRSRGITVEQWPSTLRFLPPNPPDHLWPTMIAAYALPHEPEPGVLSISSADIVGVQLTYLKRDGSGKAPIETQKRTIGRGHTAPIVLAPMGDGLGLVITEGIEDALSLHIETGLAAWAAGGAGRMPGLAEHVPPYTDAVTIIADNDEAGRKGAAALHAALRARGIDGRIISELGGRHDQVGR